MSKQMEYIDYKDCPVICDIQRDSNPITSHVLQDDMTRIVDDCFDLEFDGVSKFYPYILPKIDSNYHIIAIVGRSGSGKSTLLKQFENKHFADKQFDCSKAIISNFTSKDDAISRLQAVGLMSIPTWVKPYNVLSVGESFRANLALNVENDVIFDEFTSTIDRNVAKSSCNSFSKYIRKNDIKGVVVSSCHKDFIEYLRPDIVIDLDEEKVYDCREESLGKTLTSTLSKPQIEECGGYLGTITICLHN